MDLMGNTTDFKSLEAKYHNFLKPVILLSVIEKSMADKFVITDLSIELSCEFSANMATVKIFGVYDNEKKEFKDEVFNQTFKIGKKINIEIGYLETTELVFSGFISGFTYNFSEKGNPSITLECLDVKAVMMANNNNTQIIQEDYAAAISEIVKKSGYKDYYESFVIDSSIKSPQGENKNLIEMTDESDYDFLVRVAKKMGCEFFVSQNVLYFRKKRGKTEPIMSISHKNAIIDLEANFNIMGMVKSVEMRSLNNASGEVIIGKSQSNTAYYNSTAASKIIENASKIIIDSTINSESEAKDRADVELDDIIWKFGIYKVEVIGIPELIPGRFVTIKDLGKNINKNVYITKVEHVINNRGFKTKLEARCNKL